MTYVEQELKNRFGCHLRELDMESFSEGLRKHFDYRESLWVQLEKGLKSNYKMVWLELLLRNSASVLRQKKEDAEKYQERADKLTVGTILTYDAGYFPGFYEIVKRTDKTITIRNLKLSWELGPRGTGYVTPCKGQYTEPPVRKLLTPTSLRYGVKLFCRLGRTARISARSLKLCTRNLPYTACVHENTQPEQASLRREAYPLDIFSKTCYNINTGR